MSESNEIGHHLSELSLMSESETLRELEFAPLAHPQQSWVLRRETEQRKKKYVDKIFFWILGTFVVLASLAGLTSLKTLPSHHHHKQPPPDNYTFALHKALNFFNAQRSGELPEKNNVSWRGNSCLQDGNYPGSTHKDLVGGYYDGGDAIKSNFPMSFAMTMLSWSVIEYSSKYQVAGELSHVKELIKWGTDYFLNTFNSNADTIDEMVSQIGSGKTSGASVVPNDHYCWMRPEDIDYKRYVTVCYGPCSDLAAEMAAALASASIVFKDNLFYSEKLLHGAKTLYEYAYAETRHTVSSSSMFWDEIIWGGAWMYYATGNVTYLDLITSYALAKRAGAFSGGSYYGVFSWDTKLAGAQLLLTRLRLFMSPGYPYEDILSIFHSQIGVVMCSYLPDFNKFKRTKGGLIQLRHGDPQPLQYSANAAFLAALYSDYLEAAGVPGWYCGPSFYSTNDLRSFSKSQMDYILGKNPLNMSYVVGFGELYPKHVHHRGASIPKNQKESCKGEWKWRETEKENPNTIEGAMVAGPDKHDGFQDVRTNSNYTEPTLAGNAGLVAALVALAGDKSVVGGIDKNTIFSALPPLYPATPPPPGPWSP